MLSWRRFTQAVSMFPLLVAAASNAAAAQEQHDASGGGNRCLYSVDHQGTSVPVPSEPMHVVTTRDGCVVFVRGANALTVLRHHEGALQFVHSVSVDGAGSLILTPREDMLLVRSPRRLVVFDVRKLAAAAGDSRVGDIEDPHFSDGEASALAPGGRAVTRDGKYLFVPQFNTAWLTIIDLERLRTSGVGAAVVGGLRTAPNPVGVVLSPDDRVLYLTQLQLHGGDAGVPECSQSYSGAPPTVHRRTLLSAIDVGLALSARQSPVMASVPTGCDSASIALSPDGATLYTAGHGDATLRAYNVGIAGAGAGPALIGAVPVAPTPGDLAVIDEGRIIVATGGGLPGGEAEGHPLTFVDPSRITDGGSAVVRRVRLGAAGNIHVTADGRTLIAAKRADRALQLIALKPQSDIAGRSCNQPLPGWNEHVQVAPLPLHALATRDGCWIFVRSQGALSVLRRSDGRIEPVGKPLVLEGAPGMDLALSGDERMLIVRAPGRLVFFDVQKLTAGRDGSMLGTIESARFPTSGTPGTGLVTTPDGKHLIVANHSTAWLTVVNLDRVRQDGPTDSAVIAGIPMAAFTTTPLVSPDGRLLYAPAGRAPSELDASAHCLHSRPDERKAPRFRPGALQVIDLGRLVSAPKESIVSSFLTGCEPTSAAFGPDGTTVYVAPRADDVLLAFDVRSVEDKSPPRLLGRVPTIATGPTDIVVSGDGATIVVSSSSDRDPAAAPSFLTVIDAAKVAEGAAAVKGVIPTRSRHISTLFLASDGRTLLVPSRESGTLQIIDLDRAKLEPVPVVRSAP